MAFGVIGQASFGGSKCDTHTTLTCLCGDVRVESLCQKILKYLIRKQFPAQLGLSWNSKRQLEPLSRYTSQLGLLKGRTGQGLGLCELGRGRRIGRRGVFCIRVKNGNFTQIKPKNTAVPYQALCLPKYGIIQFFFTADWYSESLAIRMICIRTRETLLCTAAVGSTYLLRFSSNYQVDIFCSVLQISHILSQPTMADAPARAITSQQHREHTQHTTSMDLLSMQRVVESCRERGVLFALQGQRLIVLRLLTWILDSRCIPHARVDVSRL